MPEREFYVGYQPQAPPALGRFLRRLVLALVLGGMVLAVTLAVLQDPFDPGVFEFGVVREFAGTIEQRPYPMLLVDPPIALDSGPVSRFLLVGFGKNGAETEIRGHDERAVVLRGSLIHREGEHMIEIEPGGVRPAGSETSRALAAGAPDRGDRDLGTRTFRGEIVDSKCFFGVMKPGRGKPHRACATRCISGGVPPVFRVETAAGDFRHFLLTDEKGGALDDRVLDFVAEPIEITGRLSRRGDLYVLAADPLAYRRL